MAEDKKIITQINVGGQDYYLAPSTVTDHEEIDSTVSFKYNNSTKELSSSVGVLKSEEFDIDYASYKIFASYGGRIEFTINPKVVYMFPKYTTSVVNGENRCLLFFKPSPLAHLHLGYNINVSSSTDAVKWGSHVVGNKTTYYMEIEKGNLSNDYLNVETKSIPFHVIAFGV